MKRFDLYLRSVWYDLFDRDIDRLIAGRSPDNDDLAPLVGFVTAMKTMGEVSIADLVITDHASVAASMIAARSTSTTDGERYPGRLFFGLQRRLAAALTSLMMLTGLTGVAWAANGAVPGDWNYGIDRALESMGIGAGGARERLEEAMALNETGHTVQALESAAEVLSIEQFKDVGVGLHHAAEAVAKLGRGSDNATQARSRVSQILDYLETHDEIDGKVVSEMAREITDKADREKSNTSTKNSKPAGDSKNDDHEDVEHDGHGESES
jgi:hypothetical protein